MDQLTRSGFAVNCPGFIATLNSNIKVSIGAQRIYTLSWITGTGVSALMYFALCYFFPPPGMNRKFYEVDESAGEPLVGGHARDSYYGYGSNGSGDRTPEYGDKDLPVDKTSPNVNILPAH